MSKKGHVVPAITLLRQSIGARLKILALVDQKLLDKHEQMDLATVPALRLLCDNQWKALAKVLPDVKAIEHSGPEGEPLEIKITIGSS